MIRAYRDVGTLDPSAPIFQGEDDWEEFFFLGGVPLLGRSEFVAGVSDGKKFVLAVEAMLLEKDCAETNVGSICINNHWLTKPDGFQDGC